MTDFLFPPGTGLILFLPIFVVLGMGGCFSAQGPDTQFVTGKVTLDGVGVEGASVNFTPKNGEGTLVSCGITDNEGRYTITATEGGRYGKGTTVGRYHVTIVKKTMRNRPGTRSSMKNVTLPDGSAHEIEVEKNGSSRRRFKPDWEYHVPQEFEQQGKSGLEVNVQKGKNVFHFNLKSDGTAIIQ